ncbi:MAG: hypothetical protein M3513_10445, partial [Actinomycetota bacterium]|nr:hypothetical protein [Actinomycetota bacterium]
AGGGSAGGGLGEVDVDGRVVVGGALVGDDVLVGSLGGDVSVGSVGSVVGGVLLGVELGGGSPGRASALGALASNAAPSRAATRSTSHCRAVDRWRRSVPRGASMVCVLPDRLVLRRRVPAIAVLL